MTEEELEQVRSIAREEVQKAIAADDDGDSELDAAIENYIAKLLKKGKL